MSRSSLIVAGRALLFLLAAGALVVGMVAARRGALVAASARGYSCPMHREVVSAEAGTCSLCGMALEPGDRAAAGAAPPPRSVTVGGDEATPISRSELEAVRLRVFTVRVRAPAWVEPGGVVLALLYKDELAALTPDERGSFATTSEPDRSFEVKLGSEPSAPNDRSTLRVRFHLSSQGAAPPVGLVGWVTLAPRRQELLTMTAGAVLHGPAGPYVLVASSDRRTLTTRPVEIGRVFYGMAVVAAGLTKDERVEVGRAFYMDAERRQLAGAGAALGLEP